MGCSYPFLQAYILLDGSVFPAQWALWSCSGLVFCGIGDAIAAIGGKMYGRTLWRSDSKKTQEGSSYMVITMSITYYILCDIIDPRSGMYLLFFILAAIASAILEGMTL